jgi:AraC-like DNA-binding protein
VKKLYLLENFKYENFDFPVYFQHITPSHSSYQIHLQLHSELEIIRILEGSLFFEINGQEFLAKPGDVILISDTALHQGVPDNCTYQSFVFSVKLFSNPSNRCTKQIYNLLNFKSVQSKLPRDINDLNESTYILFEAIKEKKEGYELIVQASLYHIFGIILAYKLYEEKATVFYKTDEIFEKFQRVLTYIESNYMQTISLDDLATTTGFTPKYFCKFFRFMTGISPIDYVNKYRIEIACELLLNSDFHVSDISLRCGFNDISYFIKIFKKYHGGMTPRQWQQKFTACKDTGVYPGLSFRTKGRSIFEGNYKDSPNN